MLALTLAMEAMMSFNDQKLGQLGEILLQAARLEIMPRFGRLSAAQVHQKSGPFDLVTEADEAAERWITSALAQAFPSAKVIGEEAVAQGTTGLEALVSAELAIVLDPIDGTRNYASGTPLFGVMAAVVARGEVVAGVILDPITERRYYALRDGGAWREGSDGQRHPLRVASPVALGEMEAHVSSGYLEEPLRSRVNSRLSRLGAVSMLRCAAHDYRLVAEGHSHALFYNKLMPWDHAAGWLLHREAGGYSAHFDGTPYLPRATGGGLICAPDEASWNALREALLEP